MQFNRPASAEIFAAILRDQQGRPVPMTAAGKGQGKALRRDQNAATRQRSWAGTLGSPTLVAKFEINDLFVVENAGDYDLDVTVRLYFDDRLKPRKYFSQFDFPPVRSKLRLLPNVEKIKWDQ